MFGDVETLDFFFLTDANAHDDLEHKEDGEGEDEDVEGFHAHGGEDGAEAHQGEGAPEDGRQVGAALPK